ncbi:MAG: zinc-ribbon domain-containing protein [Acidobacteria bacterium]|nr:zinc-ribbon domain-containing protein [Acidobacteriota bacterium]
MPFCTQCGKQVGSEARFCQGCGAPAAGDPGPQQDVLTSITPKTVSTLCYVPVIGWIACVYALAAQRFRNERVTRFHGFQGLYLFVAWLVVDKAIGPMVRSFPGDQDGIVALLKIALIGAWLFMLFKTSQNETYRLPVVGELAERSLAEQRS